MSPKPKPVPRRLGPPVQLMQLSRIPIVQQQKKLNPKLREVAARRIKLVARWMHETLTWKKILMSWMVILVASKMVLLMLTYHFFSLTALISLQIFHGVWMIAFFCLNIIDSRTLLPNASCLLAGYLPATTVLHILLIPSSYPLEFIIIDAVGTFFAIITMFLLLRMECTEILHEAEEIWQRKSGSDTGSEVGSMSSRCSLTSTSTRHKTHNDPRYGRHIGPTVVTVTGSSTITSSPHNLDSMLFCSMDEPQVICGEAVQPAFNRTRRCGDAISYDQAIDLEPIDFEYFVDEPDQGQNRTESAFRVSFGDSPPFQRV